MSQAPAIAAISPAKSSGGAAPPEAGGGQFLSCLQTACDRTPSAVTGTATDATASTRGTKRPMMGRKASRDDSTSAAMMASLTPSPINSAGLQPPTSASGQVPLGSAKAE